jgi:fructose/tagatose bisphosphate aldolase
MEVCSMLFNQIDDFQGALRGVLEYDRRGVRKVLDEDAFRGRLIDALAFNAVFQPDAEIKGHSRFAIRTAADRLGIYPASMHDLYMLKGKGKHARLTVPAINIRGLVFDTARAVFQTMCRHDAGAVIFEIARSEINYTAQWPAEYSAVVLAAAIKERYRGPLFLQGDHFQIKANIFRTDPELEIAAIKLLIRDAVASGFFNIDIDTSTLVDLRMPALAEQQRLNAELTAMFSAYIRELEPLNTTVGIGAEIGEVGGKNSTVEELDAFMTAYREALDKHDPHLRGLSKISVQTGTTHGGVPLPDGTVAKVALDFATLERLGRRAREAYGLAGAVQHGASTLPLEMFHQFPETGTAEIHLATAFQNMVLDHPLFPRELRAEIHEFLRTRLAGQRKDGQTDEQFIYKVRKQALGPFKRRLWELPAEVREAMRADLHSRFAIIFEKLGVFNTRHIVADCTVPADYQPTLDREWDMLK